LLQAAQREREVRHPVVHLPRLYIYIYIYIYVHIYMHVHPVVHLVFGV